MKSNKHKIKLTSNRKITLKMSMAKMKMMLSLESRKYLVHPILIKSISILARRIRKMGKKTKANTAIKR